jgi:hypothetical protein
LKILFISTLSLAANPRLVKEARLAAGNGFDVEVICFEFDNWSSGINKNLVDEFNTKQVLLIPAGRSPFLPWFISVCLEKFYRMLARLMALPASVLSLAVSRRSYQLTKTLRKVTKPDWVIGHNPGALWPVLKAAKQFNCRVGFDVEDYHPGEGSNSSLQKLTKQLMIELLPQLNYVSFAAPLIRETVKKDLGYEGANWFTLMNYFPAHEFTVPPVQQLGSLKMVWFSQHICAGRGLEFILSAVKKASGKVELHLFGNLDAAFQEQYLKAATNIFTHAPLSQQQLHLALSRFDIGLALDTPVDENRDLAITNKLIAYLQAGLYIIATDTKAQEAYLAELPGHGECFDKHSNHFEPVIEQCFNNRDMIRNEKINRYQDFKNRNWETASAELLQFWRARI